MRAAIVIGLTTVAAAAAAGALYWWLSGPETIAVVVGGSQHRVPKGTTLAGATDRLGLHPRAGDLVDVQGVVLRRGASPGWLLLNGRRAPGAAELRTGDRIDPIDGRNRREPIVHTRVRVAGGEPGNPQFTLARTPGENDVARGSISGKLASIAFRPTGRTRVPNAVALTFDDGPSAYTPRVLAVLKRLRAPATFFVVGREVERRPGLVRQELAAGMGVGNHSYSHPYRPPFDVQPHARIRDEIESGEAVLARLGHRATLFRPPGGGFSAYVIEAAAAAEERIVLWSVDPTDWKRGITARRIVRNVLRAVRAGSIVLLHDGGGDRGATVRALPAIVRGIRAKGLRLVLAD